MSETPDQIQKRLLEQTQRMVQLSAATNKRLKEQGQSFERSDKNINELRKERETADKDLSHIKKNQNVFKRFLLDYLCCCCCQCCRDCCEDKTEPVFIAVTSESEEPDPDEETINRLWTQRWEPKTEYQQMDDNLKRLQEDAEECERELRKHNIYIQKLNKESKTQTKGLQKSIQVMKKIIKK